MRRSCLILLVLSVAACGVQRPLIQPKDIPAYEAARQHKREKVAQDERESAADAAGQKAIEDAQ